MSRTIMLIPTGTSVGLTSVSLGVIRAMERKGVRLSVFKPIAQPRSGGDAPDQTTTIVRASSSTTTAAEPLKMSHVESLLSSNQKDVLMEEIIANYHANTQDAEVVLVEGLVPTRKHQFAQALNFEIAKTLNAEIVFVMSQGTDTPEQLNERIELTRNSFGGAKNTSITGVIVNKLNAPVDDQGRTRPDLSEIFDDSSKAKIVKIDPAQLQKGSTLPVLELLNADDHLRDAALTIVGEGWLDRQSAFGKAPVGVAGKAARHGVPVVALCGGRDESSRQLYQHHIDAMWSICQRPMALAESMNTCEPLLADAAENVLRTFLSGWHGEAHKRITV
ncbi:AAA family ATPase [Klebsiella pneumoniae]